MQLDLKSTSKKLLYLFLVTDIAFITVHLIHVHSDLLSSPYFSLEQEQGYGEILQYIKEYWIAILLGIVAIQRRSILYLGWSLLFVYLLLDDSLAIHETLGALIGNKLGNKLGFAYALKLRVIDVGELLVSAFFGLFFLILIGTAYRFGDSAFRKASRSLIKMLLALVFCGIVVDMVHIALSNSMVLYNLLSVVEDGGEMVVMSIIAWFVFVLPDISSSSTHTNALEDQFSRNTTGVASR